MEQIQTGMFGGECEHCPCRVYSITISDKHAEQLNEESKALTHIEIECVECENVFYYTQNNWSPSFDTDFFDSEIKIQKEPPAKDTYIPKEDVINIE